MAFQIWPTQVFKNGAVGRGTGRIKIVNVVITHQPCCILRHGAKCNAIVDTISQFRDSILEHFQLSHFDPSLRMMANYPETHPHILIRLAIASISITLQVFEAMDIECGIVLALI